MNPAFSIVFFTTLVGAAQGLCVLLALADLSGVGLAPDYVRQALVIALLLLVAGLGSSVLHLGKKTRAWRAVLMWRTSWMSREVIVLPAFIALVGLWWLAITLQATSPWRHGLALLVLMGAFLLWYCTAMIYACLRFVEEWAHPLTIMNFTLVGLSSGMVLTCALAAISNEARVIYLTGTATLATTLAAWLVRALSLMRNAALRHRSTLQSATGIKSAKLVQKSMGMSAGSFNTREFFHTLPAHWLPALKSGFQILAFALPAMCLFWGKTSQSPVAWILAAVLQAPGLVAERWFFFAQAKHPQNLYYQSVS